MLRAMLRATAALAVAVVSAAAGAASATGAPVIAAAGDIACPPTHPAFNGGFGTATKCRQAATARLLYHAGYRAILPIGDLMEPKPFLKNFRRVYGPTWGKLKGKTYPVLGNHEYDFGPPSGYFNYFNGVGDNSGRAGQRGRGWYSYNLGDWHLVALNSNCGQVGCGPDSRQITWLRRNLRRHHDSCVLAYWHHPRFSSGFQDGEQPVGWFWRVLYRAGADVVLNGHDHLYERFAPKEPFGGIDRRRGIVQFTVGTGGRSQFAFGARKLGSRKRIEGRFGVIRLRLGRHRYRWRFVAVPGGSGGGIGTGPREILDRGSRRCNKKQRASSGD